MGVKFKIKKEFYRSSDGGAALYQWRLVDPHRNAFPQYATIYPWEFDGTYRLTRSAGGSFKSFDTWIGALNYARAMYRGAVANT